MMSLDVHREPFAVADWRDALRRLFVALADKLGCFFASAEIERGHLWNGRDMASDQHTERPVVPSRREGWMGLPPYPVWWSYYGAEYRELVSERLDGCVRTSAGNLFHSLSNEPTDRDQLTKLIKSKWLFRRRCSGFPVDLLSVVAPNDGRVQPVPLEPASRIPPMLT
jgi:hypothetical protein